MRAQRGRTGSLSRIERTRPVLSIVGERPTKEAGAEGSRDVANATRSTHCEAEGLDRWITNIEARALYQETRHLEGRVKELEVALGVAAGLLGEAAQLLDGVARRAATDYEDYDLEDRPMERRRHFP